MTKDSFISSYNTFELVIVDGKDTGLNCDLYFLSSGKSKKNLSPLIYVCSNNEVVSFSIDNIDPKSVELTNLAADLINKISNYIKTNYQLIMEHWNNKITDRTFLNSLNNK